MTAISTKNTVLAAVVETTEGTPVAPTSASEYVVVQDDLSFKPDIASLENNEVVNSLGKRKRILGAEKPTANFSHYLKHSGVEGQAPETSTILKALFGTKTTNGTQYAVTSGSTTTGLQMGSGVGANFVKGQGTLIKDGTNGYRIRVVDSITTDLLNLSFKVPSAPASGTNLGKCVQFTPAQTGHISLTLWRYLNQGGAVEMIAGARPTSLSIKGAAGENINCALQFAGLAYYLDPIEITSSTRYIDFEDDDGTWAAAVTAKIYKNPKALADALATAMNASGASKTYTVTYDSTTGYFTIKTTGTLLSLLFTSGTNNANTIATKIGFTTSDKTGTGATTGYTSASAPTLSSPQTATLDSTDPVAAKNQEVMIGSVSDYLCFDASDVEFTATLARTEIKSICAESGVSGSVFTGRDFKVTVKALLSKYDVAKFDQFLNNTDIRFQWSWGEKLAGNWVAGKCGYIYSPALTITKHTINNENGLAVLDLELAPHTDSSGSSEAFLGFL